MTPVRFATIEGLRLRAFGAPPASELKGFKSLEHEYSNLGLTDFNSNLTYFNITLTSRIEKADTASTNVC